MQKIVLSIFNNRLAFFLKKKQEKSPHIMTCLELP